MVVSGKTNGSPMLPRQNLTGEGQPQDYGEGAVELQEIDSGFKLPTLW